MAFGTFRVFSPFVVLKMKYARTNHVLRKGCIKSTGIIYTGGVINNDWRVHIRNRILEKGIVWHDRNDIGDHQRIKITILLWEIRDWVHWVNLKLTRLRNNLLLRVKLLCNKGNLRQEGKKNLKQRNSKTNAKF